MEELLLQALIYFACTWVFFSQAVSQLHKVNFHKLDKFLCLKCTVFFATWILTGFNLPVAAVAALMAHILDNKLNDTTL